MRDRWNKWAVLDVSVAIAFAAGVLLYFPHFVAKVEQRPGVVLPDPLLVYFTAVDLSWLTFSLIYGSFFVAFMLLVNRPGRLAHGFAAYGLMFLFRSAVMYLTPLDPPVDTIPLRDPFVQLFSSGGGVLTKDLFFSGHTASVFLLVLLATGRKSRAFFILATAGIGACVLLQKVHYSIDVFVAPAYSYLAYRMIGLLRKKLGIARDVLPAREALVFSLRINNRWQIPPARARGGQAPASAAVQENTDSASSALSLIPEE
jgi:hypothetical protein